MHMMALSHPPPQPMHPAHATADDSNRPPTSAPLTAVAVDKDKSSQQAVKWAVDHLPVGNHAIILIHVKCKNVQHRRWICYERNHLRGKPRADGS